MVILADGTKMTVNIGGDAGDPKLVITDLLPHLGAEQNKKPLPEGMDKETVQTKAEEVLALLADGDYTQVAEQFRQDVREEYGVTADTITQAMEQVAGAGAYVKLTDSTVVGGENESFDGEYAVAVLYCKHEKKKVVYQFSIDPSYQLIGFSAQIR